MPLSSIDELDDDDLVKRETMLAIQNAKTLTSYLLLGTYAGSDRSVLLVGKSVQNVGNAARAKQKTKVLAEGSLVQNANKIALTSEKGDKGVAHKALLALFRTWKAPYRVEFVSSSGPNDRQQRCAALIKALKAAMAEARSNAPKDWAKLLDQVEDLAALANDFEDQKAFDKLHGEVKKALEERVKLEEEWVPRLAELDSALKTAALQRRNATGKTQESWASIDRAIVALERLAKSIDAADMDDFDTILWKVQAEVEQAAGIDIGERKRIASLSSSPPSTPPEPHFDDCVLVASEGNYRVFLDSHQNKHQSTMIPELGAWGSKMGSRFKTGRGLQWHKDNTAKTVLAWAKAQNVGEGKKVIASKTTPLPDGNIYDAAAMNDGNFVVVVYHCNPPADE